jgi:ribosome-associated protein
MTPEQVKNLIEQCLDADKALDILTVDLGDTSSAMADYMVIASGTSSRHVSAMARKLKDNLTARGLKDIRIEGIEQADWVVVDAGDVIIHIFRPEVRGFYNLEKMWCARQPLDKVSEHVQA